MSANFDTGQKLRKKCSSFVLCQFLFALKYSFSVMNQLAQQQVLLSFQLRQRWLVTPVEIIIFLRIEFVGTGFGLSVFPLSFSQIDFTAKHVVMQLWPVLYLPRLIGHAANSRVNNLLINTSLQSQ